MTSKAIIHNHELEARAVKTVAGSPQVDCCSYEFIAMNCLYKLYTTAYVLLKTLGGGGGGARDPKPYTLVALKHWTQIHLCHHSKCLDHAYKYATVSLTLSRKHYS